MRAPDGCLSLDEPQVVDFLNVRIEEEEAVIEAHFTDVIVGQRSVKAFKRDMGGWVALSRVFDTAFPIGRITKKPATESTTMI